MSDAARARELLSALAAAPRPAGGAAESAARVRCARELAALGFTVAEHPFEYSAFPGRWATPLAGVALLVALGAAGHLGWRGHSWQALAVLLAALACVAAFGVAIGRRGVLGLPMLRARSTNLVAERGTAGGRSPHVWLVAHLDSKSQPVPILVRALGIVCTALLFLAAIVVATSQGLGAPVAGWSWIVLAALAPAATAPIVLSIVGDRSPGALDNASGVATVLLAASRVPSGAPLGVLLTSAEELGLAGARAWARTRGPGVAINCDGVDDAGALVCMHDGRRSRPLLDALRRAGGPALRVRVLLPGILTDSVALADAGWEAVTVSRGAASSLGRIHRPGDRHDRLTGEGIAGTATVVASAATELASSRQPETR